MHQICDIGVLLFDGIELVFHLCIVFVPAFKNIGDPFCIGRTADPNVSEYPIINNIETKTIWSSCAFPITLRGVDFVGALLRRHTQAHHDMRIADLAYVARPWTVRHALRVTGEEGVSYAKAWRLAQEAGIVPETGQPPRSGGLVAP